MTNFYELKKKANQKKIYRFLVISYFIHLPNLFHGVLS